MRDSKKDELRRLLMKEMHPVEKLMRIGLGSLTVEGLPRGRYRLLPEKEVEALRKSASGKKDEGLGGERRKTFTQSSERTRSSRRREGKTPR
jgi:hypothetical protein